jgi:hypothetical protein
VSIRLSVCPLGFFDSHLLIIAIERFLFDVVTSDREALQGHFSNTDPDIGAIPPWTWSQFFFC